jgi:hypothetical protein
MEEPILKEPQRPVVGSAQSPARLDHLIEHRLESCRARDRAKDGPNRALLFAQILHHTTEVRVARFRVNHSRSLSPGDARRSGGRPRRLFDGLREWRGPGSNWRHRDFQSRALPTELPRRAAVILRGLAATASGTVLPLHEGRCDHLHQTTFPGRRQVGFPVRSGARSTTIWPPTSIAVSSAALPWLSANESSPTESS